MKSCSFKGPPKKKYLYKNFSIDTFNDTLKINLDNIKDSKMYGFFEKTFLEVWDKQVPLKTKALRHNNNSCAFHFVEMQSVICLYFHCALQFFN